MMEGGPAQKEDMGDLLWLSKQRCLGWLREDEDGTFIVSRCLFCADGQRNLEVKSLWQSFGLFDQVLVASCCWLW